MKKVYIAISLLLLTYVIIRAIRVPLTHDEALSYFLYIKASVSDIVINENPSANNHILNTLLAKFCSIFSVAEFSLRFPSVLAFCLYLYISYKLCHLLVTNYAIRLCFFTALLANAALIDFFSLCRGYALGISLLMFSVYQLLLLLKTDSIEAGNKYHIILLSATLAIYANFALLIPAFGLFLIVFLLQYRNNRNLLYAMKLPFLYGLIVTGLSVYPIRRLIKADQLYYGGEKNFVDDTMYSLMEDMTGTWVQDVAYRDLLMVPFIFITALSLGVAVYYLLTPQYKNRLLLAVPLLLLFCIVCINLQFYVLHTKLVIYRTALYLYPLIVASAFSASQLLKIPEGIKRVIIFALTGLLIPGFLLKTNITHTREWWFDADNKKLLEYITKNKTVKDRKIRLFSHWLMVYSINYYIETKYAGDIDPVPVIKDDLAMIDLTTYDFVYGQKKHEISSPEQFMPVRAFADNKLLLYAKKQEPVTTVP